MKPLLTLVLLTLSSSMAFSQSAIGAADFVEEDVILSEAVENLDEFIWIKRPLVVFADSPADPRFIEQMEFITEGLADLAERDVVVMFDTDPSVNSGLRNKLHPRGFMLVLIGKDGIIKLRKPVPWDVREITRTIDKMPMRQQEIRDRRGDS